MYLARCPAAWFGSEPVINRRVSISQANYSEVTFGIFWSGVGMKFSRYPGQSGGNKAGKMAERDGPGDADEERS
ncbi:hypothetical protein GWI33_015220 [Rhynchophorus ferrugineus]|uniref:Uncharacterized protein n=1 Tax=Rhynchophorus ferrugineus TaxID=354439 RepID=A0A834I5U0_RHYFE|nr:hypothetical protein GWI33_015220 [Rhynchophorus ferrugineus]